MALCANGVATRGVQFGGIHHPRGGGIAHVLAARAVAALATHTVVQKRRVSISILCSEHGAHAAGMAPEAGGVDRAIEARFGIALIAGRRIPDLMAGIPGDWQLEKIPLALEQETTAHAVG